MRGLCTIYIPSSFLFGVIFLSINKVSWEPLEGFPFPLLSLDWGSEGGSFGSIKTIAQHLRVSAQIFPTRYSEHLGRVECLIYLPFLPL